MELINRVNVGEEEGHQAFGHGVFFDDSAAKPLGAGEGQAIDACILPIKKVFFFLTILNYLYIALINK